MVNPPEVPALIGTLSNKQKTNIRRNFLNEDNDKRCETIKVFFSQTNLMKYIGRVEEKLKLLLRRMKKFCYAEYFVFLGW
jgi:hypothetical protein